MMAFRPVRLLMPWLLAALTLTLYSCATGKGQDVSYNGIDVSHYQGDINWSVVTSNRNLKFVYIKASEGKTWQDKRRMENALGARANGLLVGYYHFFRTQVSGVDQFQNYLDAIEGLPNDLLPVLDIEIAPKPTELGVFQHNIEQFIFLCKIRFGKAPIIYTMPNFDKRYLSFCHHLEKWYCGRFNDQANLNRCLLWQIAIKPVPGIQGDVDWNYCPKIRKIKR